MEIRVVIRNADAGDGLRDFATKKLQETLARFEDSVLTAIMRLEDVTGPEKETARDKLCNVHVKLRTSDIVVKEEHADFNAAINSAMDRLKTQLSREVGRAKRGVAEG